MARLEGEMINRDNIKEAKGIILSAGYGKSFSYGSGAENGPSRTVECFCNHLEVFDRFLQKEVCNNLDIGHHILEEINDLTPEDMVKAISKFYYINKDKFILMLGGDHSVSIGAFDAISKIYNPSEVTILQIDAHPDLRDTPGDYKEKYSKFDHACTMRRGVEMGFKTVQVGIRTISIYDYEFIKNNKLKVFEWGREKTPKIKDIIKSIKTKKVYLTFDMDGLDPAHAPGTGTPIPGGLEWHYALKLIRELSLKKEIIGADIVEIAPSEKDFLTPYSAAHLCYNVLSYKLMKDKGLLKFYN